MQVTVDTIKELRQKTGVGIMECKKALTDCEGSMNAALDLLKQRGYLLAEKKKDRELGSGLVESYIHTGGQVGVLVELNCETDFVARTPDFSELAHDIAMQIAAMNPSCIAEEEVAEEDNPEEVCLLLQPFIKDPQKTIQEIIVETIGKVGENIRLRRFSRFDIGA